MSERASQGALSAAGVQALVRIAVICAIVVSDHADKPIELREDAFEALIAVAVVWAIFGAVVALVERDRPPSVWAGAIDLALLGGLAWATGGPFSEVKLAFFVVPVLAAITQSPARTAAWAGAAIAVFAAAASAENVGTLRGAEAATITACIYLALTGIAAVLVASLLRSRQLQAAAKTEESRALSGQLIEARETERRDLATRLHDGPMQILASAEIELAAARRGDPQAFALLGERISRAQRSLRQTTFDLSPYALQEIGLCEAINQVLEAECATVGLEGRSDCESLEVSAADGELFATARELIRNAARHSHGSYVDVWVGARNGAVAIRVSDDGVGFDEDRKFQAVKRGHIGLITSRERLAKIGCELVIASGPSRTVATVRPTEQLTGAVGSDSV